MAWESSPTELLTCHICHILFNLSAVDWTAGSHPPFANKYPPWQYSYSQIFDCYLFHLNPSPYISSNWFLLQILLTNDQSTKHERTSRKLANKSSRQIEFGTLVDIFDNFYSWPYQISNCTRWPLTRDGCLHRIKNVHF